MNDILGRPTAVRGDGIGYGTDAEAGSAGVA